MRIRRAIVVTTPLIATICGCLLTSNFDGIVGVHPDDGSTLDSTVDGGGGGGSDGPTTDDGGDADTGISVSPCAADNYVFCTDFDDTIAPPVIGWSNTPPVQGSLSIDVDASVSPPHSLITAVKSKMDGGVVGSYLLREAFVGTTYKSLTLAFDFRMIDCKAQQSSSLTFIYLGTGTDSAYGFVILSAGTLAFGFQVKGSPDSFLNFNKPVLADKWTHIDMKLAVKSSTLIHVNINVDGANAVDSDAPTTAPKQTVTVNVGVQGSQAPNGCTVAYDNVVLTKDPN